MEVHAGELESARAYGHAFGFEELTPDQTRLIVARGRDLYKWFKAHTGTHTLINAGVIAGLLAADWWVLTELPRRLASFDVSPGYGAIVLAAAIVGALHSWLGYSLSIFSLHEGAAHNLIFPGSNRISRIAQFLSKNLCRLANAEPNHYADCHMAHHARFGTEEDPEFLNFVAPRRFWFSLLPFAMFVNFSDFVIHRPMRYTRDRVLSSTIAAFYNGVYAYAAYRRFGALFTIVAFLVVLPHVGFWLDRLRQFTEHNLMPLENNSGSRSFGVGFWGLLVGGGPWGQPCHLVHHLVPSIPWYQQVILHRFLASLLTESQRAQFLVRPIVGYPLLVWTIFRDLKTFARRDTSNAAPL